MMADARRALRSGLRKLHAFSQRGRYEDIDFIPISHAPETVPCKPGVYDPDTLERVVSCGFATSMETQRNKLDATEFVERPVSVARLPEATVMGGEIFSRGKPHFMVKRPKSWRAHGGIEEIHTPVTLANSEQGLKYFGHWLRDDCAVYPSLAEDFGGTILSMERPSWSDAVIYEQAFGQTWDDRSAFWTPELTLVRELGFNLRKQARIRELRAQLRKAHKPIEPGSVIYLARGPSSASRDIVNDDDLRQALSARGVKVMVPEGDGTALVETLLDARVIITIEGSQAAHGTYTLADKGALLVLQPPTRFYNPHVEWTRLLDMDYGIVIGREKAEGFHIDPKEVLTMVDRLLALDTVAV